MTTGYPSHDEAPDPPPPKAGDIHTRPRARTNTSDTLFKRQRLGRLEQCQQKAAELFRLKRVCTLIPPPLTNSTHPYLPKTLSSTRTSTPLRPAKPCQYQHAPQRLRASPRPPPPLPATQLYRTPVTEWLIRNEGHPAFHAIVLEFFLKIK